MNKFLVLFATTSLLAACGTSPSMLVQEDGQVGKVSRLPKPVSTLITSQAAHCHKPQELRDMAVLTTSSFNNDARWLREQGCVTVTYLEDGAVEIVRQYVGQDGYTLNELKIYDPNSRVKLNAASTVVEVRARDLKRLLS